MRPADLPSSPDRYKHGTRGSYVAGCRCDPCRASNTAYYHDRRRRELEALAELEPGPPALERPVVHVKLDPRTGRTVTHHFKNPCPGLGRTKIEQDAGCSWGSFLRKDSQAVCSRCRAESVADYLVDAKRARRRIRWLRRNGVGRRSIGDAAGVARSSISAIADGRKLLIRLSTERRILELDDDARAGGAWVDAGPTWRLLEQLLEEGFTKTELARRLGSKGKTPSLQMRRDRVLASTALRVAKFHRMIMAGG